MIPRVEIVELCAAAGYDAVVLDLEHAPINVEVLPELCAAASASSIHVIARLGDSSDALVAAVLDSGVDGVLVPHVSSAEQARGIVAAGRYPPDGGRSLNPYVRGNRYGLGEGSGITAANARVAIIAMIEDVTALANLDEICAVQGLDAVFVGPVDLSGALGVPGQPEHPRVLEEIRRVIRAARVADVLTGIYAPHPEAAARWFDDGVQLVALSADIAMAVSAFQAAVTETQARMGARRPAESVAGA
jgi:4-hydroxy-2-oxoheptanedioate aldolase